MPLLRPPFPSWSTGKQHYQPPQNPTGTPENHTKGLKALPTSEQFCTKWRSDPFRHPCNVLFYNLALRHIHPLKPYTDPMENGKEWHKTQNSANKTHFSAIFFQKQKIWARLPKLFVWIHLLSTQMSTFCLVKRYLVQTSEQKLILKVCNSGTRLGNAKVMTGLTINWFPKHTACLPLRRKLFSAKVRSF